MNENDILTTGNAVSVPLTREQAQELLRFGHLLKEWNERFNLTALTDDTSILTLHFADSLTLVPVIQALQRDVPLNVIDVGTGGGFPGIPLRIAMPSLHMTLMDSTTKKVQFCDHVIRELNLAGTHAVHGRAEEAAHRAEHRERYDVVVARAVAPLPTLVEYLLPFAKVGGHVVAMKGSDAHNEVHDAVTAINKLGGEIVQIDNVILPGRDDKRALVILRKSRHSLRIYPRQGGAPRKTPLK